MRREQNLILVLTCLATISGGILSATPSQAQLTSHSPPAQIVTTATTGWRITPVGPDWYQISWTSQQRLPIRNDRPQVVWRGVSLPGVTISKDGQTVVAKVRAKTKPRLRDLDVLFTGDRLDEPGLDRLAAPDSARVRSQAVPLADNPAAPGPYQVTSSDYDLDPVKLPRMPEPIEMVGHVVEPAETAATGQRPLVVFLHGRHSYCYDPNEPDAFDFNWPCRGRFEEIPSHLGYQYLQEVLASQGYTTVSIRVNGINAQDFALEDGGALARAKIVQAHLNYWVTQAVAHQVDLQRVVLVGHSRGGEGVHRASLTTSLAAPYRIVGQVLVAPVNFGTQSTPYVPTVTLLPYCDGDVSDLQGQKFTDMARDVVKNDPVLHSSVMMLGANHNFFNTEWTPGVAVAPSFDDWFGPPNRSCGTATPDRLSDSEQRAAGLSYVAGAVRLFAAAETEFVPLFDGSPVVAPGLGDTVVISHALGGDRDLRRPGIDTGLSLAQGAKSQLCIGSGLSLGGNSSATPRTCGRHVRDFSSAQHWPANRFEPWRKAFEMEWAEVGQTAGLTFDTPLNLSAGRLELRTVVDPTFGRATLDIQLTDTAGNTAVVTPLGGGKLLKFPLGRELAKRWAQPLVVDPATAGGVDLSAIERVDLVAQPGAGLGVGCGSQQANLAASAATPCPSD
jgi:dienelactone hydrolase